MTNRVAVRRRRYAVALKPAAKALRPPGHFIGVEQKWGSTCWAATVASCLASFDFKVDQNDPEGPEVSFAKLFACGGVANCPPSSWNQPRDVSKVLRRTAQLSATVVPAGSMTGDALVRYLELGAIFVVREYLEEFHVTCAFMAVPASESEFFIHVFDPLGGVIRESRIPSEITRCETFLVTGRLP